MLTNSSLAELLAVESHRTEGRRARALRRASRAAFVWDEEAIDLVQEERSLTELPAVGPFIGSLLRAWLEDPPDPPRSSPLRHDFLTMTEARRILRTKPARKSPGGDLQVHSRYSDGNDSIAEIAEAARARGYAYIAVTDHSKGLKIAGGLDEEDLRRQSDEIDALSEKDAGPFRIIKSLEMNLDTAGKGDMEESVTNLELVLGAFHSKLREKEDQTPRYLAAIGNPHVDVLAHPRGRIYNFRAGLSADWDRVFGAAAEGDKAVEIDCFPDRQDLNVALLRKAKRAGVRISIGTDAHSASQLHFIELGLAAAVRVGIPEDRILNYLSADEIVEWAGSHRG